MMSSTKIYSVVVVAMVLCVTSMAVAGPVELPPSQAAARQGGAVLFYVAHEGSLRDIELDPIIFDQVLVNQGSAYDGSTGVFTAPVAGVYQFVFTAQLCRGNHNNSWLFKVNGAQQMLCHAQVSGGDTTLNTCYYMAEMRRGDRFEVQQRANSCAWANAVSRTISLSGVLLSASGTSVLPGRYGNSCPLMGLQRMSGVASRSSRSSGQSAAACSLAAALLLRLLLD